MTLDIWSPPALSIVTLDTWSLSHKSIMTLDTWSSPPTVNYDTRQSVLTPYSRSWHSTSRSSLPIVDRDTRHLVLTPYSQSWHSTVGPHPNSQSQHPTLGLHLLCIQTTSDVPLTLISAMYSAIHWGDSFQDMAFIGDSALISLIKLDFSVNLMESLVLVGTIACEIVSVV